METSIFYFVTIYLPTLIILFSFGNIVFSIGEFKKGLDKVPKLLLLMLAKYIALTSMLLYGYHYVFEYHIHEANNLLFFHYAKFPNMTEFLLMVSGNYLTFELLSSNKLITHYTKFSECLVPDNLITKQQQLQKLNHFDSFAKKVTSKIFLCNKLVFVWTSISAVILFFLILVILTVKFSFFVFSLFIMFSLTLYVKYIILKYLNSTPNKF